MRGKRYETEKVITSFKGNQYVNSGGRQNDDNQKKFKSSMQNANLKDKPKTSYTLAEEYGVNPSTIQRDASFSKVVDILPEPSK